MTSRTDFLIRLGFIIVLIALIIGIAEFTLPSGEPAFECQTYELHGVGIIGPPWIVDGRQVVGAQRFAKLTCNGHAEIEVDGEPVRVLATRTLFEADEQPPRIQTAPAQAPGQQAQAR